MFGRKQKKRQAQYSDKYVRDLAYADMLPKDGYIFQSDYFQFGDRVGTILAMVVDSNGAHDLDPFWRLQLIPVVSALNAAVNTSHGTDPRRSMQGVHAELIEGYANRTKDWVKAAQSRAHWITGQEVGGEGLDTTETHGRKVVSRLSDLQQIALDIGGTAHDGYADWSVRVLITAKSLEDLDTAVATYRQGISNSTKLGGVNFVAFQGQQGLEFRNLMHSAHLQLGNSTARMMGTSSEYAGGYDLVTQGISDRNGSYIGRMLDDYNQAAVLMDLDNYDDHVVIAHNAPAMMFNINSDQFDAHTMSSTLFGVRLAQWALVNNCRVVHFVLNEARPQNIGADLSDITTTVGLNRGSINPFEVQGDHRHKMAAWAAHKQKLQLMIQQIQANRDDVKMDLTSTDLNSTLSDIIEDFYKDWGMMVNNPENNLKDVKLFLPHEQYPKLSNFMIYLNTAYNQAIDAGDHELAASINRVRGAFKVMDSDDRDLFNVYTDNTIDEAQKAAQVIYEFSGLALRGRGVEMAQFVNAFQYATQQLQERDVVVIHGCDLLTKFVKPYIDDVLTQLRRHGIRVVYLYDDLEHCLRDYDFNHFRDTDYRMLGGFNAALVRDYTEITQEALPGNVASNLTELSKKSYSKICYYLNRQDDNIIFALDMNLGVRANGMLSANPKRIMETSAEKKKNDN